MCTVLFQVLKWPNQQQQDEFARENQLKYGLPDVVGCLDGTHIRLAYCPKSDRDYINRKNFPSMQLQLSPIHHYSSYKSMFFQSVVTS